MVAMDQPSILVIGYWPLLDYTSVATSLDGVSIDPSNLSKDLLPEVDVRAVLWLLEDDKSAPVLVLENARKVADHLLAWCENRASEWFRLVVCERDGWYAVSLFPTIEKSADRFREKCRLMNFDLSNFKITVVFDPLGSRFRVSDSFRQVQHKFGKSSRVRLLDIQDFDPSDWEAMESKVVDLGEFETVVGDAVAEAGYGQYFDHFLSDMG